MSWFDVSWLDMWHRTRRGHWPVWERRDSDFLTWRIRCRRCEGGSRILP